MDDRDGQVTVEIRNVSRDRRLDRWEAVLTFLWLPRWYRSDKQWAVVVRDSNDEEIQRVPAASWRQARQLQRKLLAQS
jgi:hypothetical protein